MLSLQTHRVCERGFDPSAWLPVQRSARGSRSKSGAVEVLCSGEQRIKSKYVRLAGFVLAAGVTASLVGFAASSTGAYFTDSKSGTVNASTGGVHVNTSSLTLNFAGLLPGDFKTNTVSYTAAGSAAEDIWLVLPAGGADAFNGRAGTPAGDTALGRYGHFAVNGPAGSFTSWNLATERTGSPSGSTCAVTGNGFGGSDTPAVGVADLIPYCPVPSAILLSSNLTYGQSESADVTFGFTKLLRTGQDQVLAPVAAFKLVATQHGILPNDPNSTP